MQQVYKVTIYKSLAGRFCIRHPMSKSGVHYIHNKDFASLSYAKQWCKKQEWQYEVKETL